MPETIAITREQLRKALWQWETNARDGSTRTADETRSLNVDQVADESTEHLWALLSQLTDAA